VACIEYLRRARWPNGFECPRCKGRESVTIATRRLEQCKKCRRQTSLTAGTVLQGTRKPLRLWFLAMFFMGRHKTGISALQLQKDLGLGSYKTAWTWMHKLRSAL
jgi:transposase-like protein